jgi:hypothetical protein
MQKPCKNCSLRACVALSMGVAMSLDAWQQLKLYAVC